MSKWDDAEEHLKACEQAYGETGRAGVFAMMTTINPCRDRFNNGERSQDLFDEIMDIPL